MLKWMLSRKTDEKNSKHPLGTEKALEEVLAGIDDIDPVRRIREINDWLDDVENLAEQLDLVQLVRVIDRLENFIQPDVEQCWHKIWSESVKTEPGPMPVQILEIHHRFALKANSIVLKRVLADAQLREDKRIPTRHVVRALRAWVLGKKLARMTYRDPGASVWKAALDLVIVADENQILNLPQNPFSNSKAQTTAWQEFVVGLLFEIAPLSVLSINEMEVVERLARHVEQYVQHAQEPQPDSVFFIDLQIPNAPVRYRPGTGLVEGRRRYFSLGTGSQLLLDLRANMNNDRKLPSWLESSGCNLLRTRKLLNMLAEHWSSTPPMRGRPRRRMKGEVFVTWSLEVVRRMVSASEFAHSRRTLDYEGYLKSTTARHRGYEAISADAPPPVRTGMETLVALESEGARQMMEKWEVIDASEQGLGARLPGRKPWHTIGALVGYRFEEEMDWHVGIIRRLGVSHGLPNVGLSVFPGIPQCSQLRSGNPKEDSPWANQTRETSGLGWRDAIVLDEASCLLVAPPGTFNEESRVEISIEGSFRPVFLEKLISCGTGYEVIQYRDVEKLSHPPA